jgi:bifunctional diaminopimelate decarboxylase / aspartate kinase
MIVCKFGGTSVADRDAQARLASIVRDRLKDSPLVVVSALSGVSDRLIRVFYDAEGGRDEDSARALRDLAEEHRALLESTPARPAMLTAARTAVEDSLAMLEELRRGAALLGDVTPWARARFVGSGEILSSWIVAAAIDAAGVEAAWVDARTVLRTAGVEPERDLPVPDEIVASAARAIAPLLAKGRAIVTQGFIGGAVVDGVLRPTLLGRGGSDYSASLLGRALRATRVEIWTDVDGVLTANPNIVSSARRVKTLSFEEASELAYFGARVLHPSTLLPAVDASIPVWVGNARRPEGSGTTILARGIAPGEGRFAVKAIADKRGITAVEVVSTRMLMAHGFLARIFAVFEAHRTSVDLVATSEVSVSLTIDDDRRLGAIVAQLSEFARVDVEREMAVVCLVGEGMRGNSQVAAEVFRVLRNVPVRMITQGSSAINLSLVMEEREAADAVRALHDTFFRGPLPADVFGAPAHESARRAPQPPPVPAPALLTLAERHGTPLYVYDLEAIEARVATLRKHLPLDPGRLLFACKANAHPEILKALARLGVGVEAASPGEAGRAIECGHAPRDVLVSATNARAPELAALAARGCRLALGSMSDIRRVGALARGTAVLLRINPGVGEGHHRHVVTGGAQSKFGIPLDQWDDALRGCQEAHLEVAGLHAHMGSGILDAAPLVSSARALLAAARRLPRVDVLDFGGGFGIPYRDGEAELDLAAYGGAMARELGEFAEATGARPEAWFEPGRFIVGPAGWLLARVVCRKESGGHVFIGLDTGMSHFLRPALYGAYHRILNLSAPDAEVEWVEVVGNVCESTDVFASARALPRAEEGHVLAILDAGAYGFTMASAYNLWPLPKEVVVPGAARLSSV